MGVHLVFCVEPHLAPQARLLVESVRANATGWVRGAALVAARPADVPPAALDGATRACFQRHGVHEMPLPALPWPGCSRATHKALAARAVEAQAAAGDRIVLLDTDLVLVGPVGEALCAGGIAASPVWARGFGSAGPGDAAERLWSAVFAAAGAPLDDERLASAIVGETMRPYFNAGVVSATREAGLFARWCAVLDALQADHDRLACLRLDTAGPAGDPLRPAYFIDQFALAAAIAIVRAQGVLLAPLPIDHNHPFLTARGADPAATTDITGLAVLHYNRYGHSPRHLAGLVATPAQRALLAPHLPFAPAVQPPDSFAFFGTLAAAAARWHQEACTA